MIHRDKKEYNLTKTQLQIVQGLVSATEDILDKEELCCCQ